MNPRALGMLGLCVRAGKIITGEKAVVQAIRRGTCCLVLLDGGVAGNGEKAVAQACDTHQVPLLYTQPGELGDAIGKPNRMAAAITDLGMAARLKQLWEDAEG